MRKLNISKYILIFFDFISLSIPLFILAFYFDIFNDVNNVYLNGNEIIYYYVVHFSVVIGIIFLFWFYFRHYTYSKPIYFELKEILQGLILFFIIELALDAIFKLYVSRYFWFSVWGGIIIGFPIVRILVRYIMIRYGIYSRDTVIIGDYNDVKYIYNVLKEERYLGFNVKLFVCNDTGEDYLYDIPVSYDNPDLVLESFDKERTHFILAVDKLYLVEQNLWLRNLIKNKFRYVSVIPHSKGIPIYGADMSYLFSHEIMLLRLNNNLAKFSSKFIKRTMDVILSLSLIVLLFFPMLVISSIIRKDGGKAIFKHKRIGLNGIEFNCLKFRTMINNSEKVLDKLLEDDFELKEQWEKDFKLKNDPRITKVGGFLRKYSLDELPQLFNVLKGEMSLVGPRPITLEELSRYELNSDYYFMVKPGMTGLWQVSGRSNVDYETRVYFDSWYVKNWSLWNDVIILLKTISVVLKNDGAY